MKGASGWGSASMGSAVSERTAPAAPGETLPADGVGLNWAGGLGQLPPRSPSARRPTSMLGPALRLVLPVPQDWRPWHHSPPLKEACGFESLYSSQ